MTELVLGGEFPTPTTEQWQGLVAKIVARSGVPGDAIEALTSHTPDGIAIAPLYTAAQHTQSAGLPGAFPFTRGRTTDGLRNGWDVRAAHADPDPKSLSEAALVDLDGGVSSLWLQIGPGATAVADLPAALHARTDAGLSGTAALNQIEFRLAATADQFGTVAKLRAARRTWAAVAAQCGERGPAAGMRQHVVTSWPMMTRHDPWNNMLRTT